MSTRGRMIQMTMSDGATLGVYHVEPAGQRRGGLVLIQEIFGVTDHIKEQADRFADQGFEVLAPAIYDREAPGFQASYSDEDRARATKIAREQHPFQLSVADAQTCIEALAKKGKAFITGYCYGGSVSWVAACRSDSLAAASGYYGSLVPQFAHETPKCPTILHFGKHDTSIPQEGVQKVIDAHPQVPVYLYDAGHGFNSDRRKDYDPESARLAFERTLALFQSAT
jgi:carboxymethylenebutenolidase